MLSISIVRSKNEIGGLALTFEKIHLNYYEIQTDSRFGEIDQQPLPGKSYIHTPSIGIRTRGVRTSCAGVNAPQSEDCPRGTNRA